MYYLRSVLVGAPRAQSTLDSQKNINETGAIYKCSFDKLISGSCAPFVFDATGNGDEANNQYTYNNDKKDHQWLGASMDGGASDNDKFVVSGLRDKFQLISSVLALISIRKLRLYQNNSLCNSKTRRFVHRDSFRISLHIICSMEFVIGHKIHHHMNLKSSRKYLHSV